MAETATERNARKNKEAVNKLADYKAKGYHMLIPAEITVDDIMEGFALTVSEPIFLFPHPRDKDVYAHDTTQWDWQKADWKHGVDNGNQLVRFHKAGYFKLARAANIEWTKPSLIHDTSGKDLRVYAEIALLYRTHEGNYWQIPNGKGIDMEAVKLNKPKDYNRIRENIDQLCLTGAKLRCIREAFVQCLPEVVPVNYLKLPFIAVKILPFLDYSDPYTKKLLIQMQVASMAGIYGIGAPTTVQPEQIAYKNGVIDPSKCGDDPDIIDAETTTGNATPYHLEPKAPLPTDDEPPFSTSTGPSPDSLRADFEACDADQQCQALRGIAGRVGRDIDAELKATGKSLEKCSPAYRLKLYDWMIGSGKEKAA